MKQHRRLLSSAESLESVNLLAILTVLVIISLALIGWMLDLPIFKGVSPHWTPMRIITIICFFMSAAATVSLQERITIRWTIIISRAFAAGVSAVGVLTLASYLIELKTGQEWSWARSPFLSIFLASSTRMAVITAMLFSVYGCILLLLANGTRRAADAAHAILLPMSMMTYMILIGYLFQVRIFYEWMHLGVALNTGVAFAALCIASFFTRPDTWLMNVFIGDKAGAIMARRLLPPLLTLPLLIGWLRLQGERAGIFSSEVGVALVAVTYTVCFLSLVWLTAKSVNRTDQQRRNVEENLRESEQLLKHALEAGDLGVWGLDTNTGKVWRSLRHDQIFGYEALLPEWTYQMFLDHVLQEDRKEVDQKFGHALSTGTEWSFECRIRSTDGVFRWIWAQGKPRMNDRNEVAQMVGIVKDITHSKHMEDALRRALDELELRVRERTSELSAVNEELLDQIEERKRTEQALRMANAYNRSLLEASLDPLVTIDTNGRITDVNTATETVTGYSRGELIGTDFSGYFSEPEKAKAGYQRVFRESTVHDYALEIKQRGGRLTSVLYNAAVYRDETGAIVGVFAAARDITKRKLAEKELERYRQHLEELVEDRTVELTAANKELESFAYSVSHDLRAPLRHMSGFVELLRKGIEGFPDEKLRHYAEIISVSSKKMGILIDDLLAFSRIGRSDIKMEVVDVNKLIREVVWEFTDELKGRDIEWKIGNLPHVYGDPSMLSLTLANLISNAVKFTRPCPRAEIEIACLKSTDGECVFFVKDNGVGFDMKFEGKLFGIFQRLHHDDEFEGTGIGLANVRRIISRHGGRTWAEGALGQGATFYFTLPTTEETKACRN